MYKVTWESLTVMVTFESRLKGGKDWARQRPGGRLLQAEGRASAKAMCCEHAWKVQGTSRQPGWLEEPYSQREDQGRVLEMGQVLGPGRPSTLAFTLNEVRSYWRALSRKVIT